MPITSALWMGTHLFNMMSATPTKTAVASKLSHCCKIRTNNIFEERKRLQMKTTTIALWHFSLSRSNPKNCFCHDRKCVTKAWECHKVNEAISNINLLTPNPTPAQRNLPDQWPVVTDHWTAHTLPKTSLHIFVPVERVCLQAPGKYSSKSSECDAMEKCKGKKCSCVGNTCENMCDKTEDCETKEHWCFKDPSYSCK